MTKRTVFLVLAILLVLITVLPYMMISMLSLMAFDSGYSWQAFTFSGTVIGISILLPIASLIVSIKIIRKERYWKGLLVSAIPGLVFGGFWFWLSQQSFT